MYKKPKYPSRVNIKDIVSLFGWGVIYTGNFINIDIGAESPTNIMSVLHMIPFPIGSIIRIVGDC
jgi:hypothetical protein